MLTMQCSFRKLKKKIIIRLNIRFNNDVFEYYITKNIQLYKYVIIINNINIYIIYYYYLYTCIYYN